MRKYFFLLPLFLIIICAIGIIYLSYFGIKTQKFNELIYSKLTQLNPKLNADIEDVFIKFNISEKSLDIQTKDVELQINNEKLVLDRIIAKLSIANLLQDKNSIKDLKILTKENKIENLKKFISEYDFNFARELIFNQIKGGYINAQIIINFVKNENNFNYDISGNVIDAKIDVLNKLQLQKIHFDFEIKKDLYNISNLKFTCDEIDFNSKILSIKKNDDNFDIDGDISNKKQKIDIHKFTEIFNYDLNLIKKSKISFSSKNNFSFKLSNKKKLKDFKFDSFSNFDEINFKETLNLPINIKNGDMNLKYIKDKLNININTKYYFNNDKNNKSNLGDAQILVTKNNFQNLKINSAFSNKNNKINISEIKNFIKLKDSFLPNQDITFDSKNSLSFELNKKNQIKNYKLNSNLKINELEIFYKDERLNKLIPDYKNKVFLKETLFDFNISDNSRKIKSKGEYSIEKKESGNFNILLNQEQNNLNFESDIELNNVSIKIDPIQYEKNKNIPSKLFIKGSLNKNYKIDQIKYIENENYIFLDNFELTDKFKIKKINTLNLNYENDNKKVNQLILKKNDEGYSLTSKKFDAQSFISNIIKGESNKNFLNRFEKLNAKLLLNFERLNIDKNSQLNNLKGEINIRENKVKSAEILAKLNKTKDFTLNINTTSNKEKITNLFIDEPAPFIKNYKFIKGFEEGNLSYGSIEKNNNTKSNLKIYDFKVKEVPVLAKLLTLASLQGIADLLTGEGIRFDEFEMDYNSNNSTTKINEMYAIGPAISILMEGYIEKDKLTSLKGTLVPATTINKTISKIPLLGDILVGKKVGEGVFGVSFKIKGPSKDLKTSVNPLKTLTPRFITRTLEKLKKN